VGCAGEMLGEAVHRIESLVYGGAKFSEEEEFLRFRFRLLFVLLLLGTAFCALLIGADALVLNDMPAAHVSNLKLMFFTCVAMSVALYGHKERFAAIAWLYIAATLAIFYSAMVLVQEDSLRAVWYFIVVPAAYILLGRAAGILVTSLSLASIFLANAYLGQPFAEIALVTFTTTLVFASIFFYFYSQRVYSFYVGMVQANRQLRELALTDPLTGLMNARAYYTLCNQMIRNAQRSNAPFAVLFIDIDHFKRINDTYGHGAGDEVLRKVGGCVRGAIRQSDVLGRIGGEEFSLLLYATEQAGAIRLAEKLRADIEQLNPLVTGTEHIQITASIGVACSRPYHFDIEQIQREADMAMYQAKQQGRNRVTVFEQAV